MKKNWKIVENIGKRKLGPTKNEQVGKCGKMVENGGTVRKTRADG